MVDVGAAGRQSDGGVFQASEIGQKFINNEMNVPAAAPLVSGGPELPFVLVGDEAFALSEFMMRPYPRCNELNLRKRVFNYRLSRARRIIECAFGTLVRIFQVLASPMKTSLLVNIQVVNACVCLHNFLIIHDKNRERCERDLNESNTTNYDSGADEDEAVPGINTHERIRFNFSKYFMEEGAIDFQWQKALNSDF